MPTTCGFPNCKFRSRYRGQEDNRHFYRIPKRPAVLRHAWLNAIGRSEETVLRICSAHFFGGEKHEGDIPVADPQIDTPEFIQLPPKESRAAERKNKLKALSSSTSNNITSSINNNLNSKSKLLLESHLPSSTNQLIRHSRRGQRTNFGLNSSLFSPYNHQKIIKPPTFNKISNQLFGNLNSNLINDNSKRIDLETKINNFYN
ncbi:THAP-type domain-containing protein [Meloidogyne graminicola]|uniref:THAP-type domain-containing protein n=1 Tax=Meloidogyne graminicola TaxID=189291 RepID=A0A8S9ZI65_9BILA|nr:THAP-type domain-containing protein [Meloidogyne graminicola]